MLYPPPRTRCWTKKGMLMQAAQGIAKGDVLQRIAGIGFLVGGIASLAGNVVLRIIAAETPTERGETEPVERIALLVLIMGFWALLVGAVGIYRSLSTGTAAVWARLGFYGILGGTTLATVSLAIDLAASSAAAFWVAAGAITGTSEYAVAVSLNVIANSVFDVTIVGYWLALLALGIGMVLSDTYPRWLGWALLVLSAVVVAVSVPRLFIGSNPTLDIVFAIPAGLTSIWALVLGVWVTRKAW